MKPISGLLEKIPHRGLRRVVALAGMLAFSLVLGFVLEKTLNAEALSGAKKAQDEWIATVSSLTPMGLVDGYWGDVGAAATGKWLYEPPPKKESKNSSAPTPVTPSAAEIACTNARAKRLTRLSCSAQFPGAELACRDPLNTDPACTAYLTRRADETSLLADPIECYGLTPSMRDRILAQLPIETPLLAQADAPSSPSAQLHPILIPLAAIVHGVTRIIDGGLGTILLAVFQLGVGFVLFLVLTPFLNKSREPGFGDGWMNYILGPISVILLGSLVALVFQGIMLGALYLFSWITGLAAAAAGATGIVGGAWWSAQKLTEKGIEDAVTKRV